MIISYFVFILFTVNSQNEDDVLNEKNVLQNYQCQGAECNSQKGNELPPRSYLQAAMNSKLN
jgi:hypothetical protein